MSKQLPPRPSLEQLKKQAKDLRKAHSTANPEAGERIRAFLPRLSSTSAAAVLEADFSLQEAQHVVAREYGFKDWIALAAVVEPDFDALVRLSDREIQTLLRAID